MSPEGRPRLSPRRLQGYNEIAPYVNHYHNLKGRIHNHVSTVSLKISLQVTHPILHKELLDAWTAFHPSEAPVAEKSYECSKGTYIPPHLAENGNSGAYNQVYSFDVESDDKAITPNPPHIVSMSNQSRFVISGKYVGSEPCGNGPRHLSVDIVGDNKNDEGSSNVMKVYDGIVDQTSRLVGHTSNMVGKVTSYFKSLDPPLQSNPSVGAGGTHDIADVGVWSTANEQMTTININGIEESISF